jgi:peptide/nickel transport system substrate-binding protein
VWHDGQPLTSEDVAFTFQYIQEQEAPEFPFIIELLDSVETPDDLTVVVHLKKPFAWAADAFGTAFIIPKHVWEGQPYDMVIKTSEEAVGSGPFKFDSRTEGEFIKLVKNQNYWMAGKPKIEEFILRVITEESARLMAIKAGEADTERYSVEPPHIKEVMTWTEVKVIRSADVWDYNLFLNNKSPPFNDTQVRKAIAYAINRTEMVEIAALGYGTPQYSYVPSAIYGELENPNARLPTYDPDMANKILDEAGYLDFDGDGIREFPREEAPPTPTWPYIVVGLVVAVVVVLGVYVAVKRRRASPKG